MNIDNAPYIYCIMTSRDFSNEICFLKHMHYKTFCKGRSISWIYRLIDESNSLRSRSRGSAFEETIIRSLQSYPTMFELNFTLIFTLFISFIITVDKIEGKFTTYYHHGYLARL